MSYSSAEDDETANQGEGLSYCCSMGPLSDEPLPSLYALINAQHPHAVTSIYLIIRFANVPLAVQCEPSLCITCKILHINVKMACSICSDSMHA